MNTGFRRFILRLAVGLLAFFIGIGVSWAIGGLNPFQNSWGTRSYKKRCGSHRSWSAAPSETHDYGMTSETMHVYEGRSCKTKRILVDVPPPPPPPAPAAPVTLGGS